MEGKPCLRGWGLRKNVGVANEVMRMDGNRNLGIYSERGRIGELEGCPRLICVARGVKQVRVGSVFGEARDYSCAT